MSSDQQLLAEQCRLRRIERARRRDVLLSARGVSGTADIAADIADLASSRNPRS